MKKIVSFFVSIIIMISFCSCSENTLKSNIAKDFIGDWFVQAVYIDGKLIAVNDVDRFKDMFDSTRLTIAEDGSFLYCNIFNYRGNIEPHPTSEDTFVLRTESVFLYDMEGTKLVEKEHKTDYKPAYMVVVMDDEKEVIAIEKYDEESGKMVGDGMPLLLAKGIHDSDFIEENKSTIKSDKDDPVKQPEATPEPTSEPTPNPTPKPTPKPTPNYKEPTSGDRNALRKAKDYLAAIPMSYDGLIEQLEFEGFSYSEAKYAADNCGADWYEQAVLKAKDYLTLMGFSRSELIEQLEFEGFTYEQASYAVNKVY